LVTAGGAAGVAGAGVGSGAWAETLAEMIIKRRKKRINLFDKPVGVDVLIFDILLIAIAK
jgi:hypothetical protein